MIRHWTTSTLITAAMILPILGCRAYSNADAENLVRTYNAKLIEAFRTGDEQLMEGLVGDEEGKKLLGLIGVKTDMGINLDSQLADFRVLRVERPGKASVEVLTEERWTYQNRQIGSGRIAGLPSEDHYVMRYTLVPAGKVWVVSRVAFEKPPVVGRDTAPNEAPAKIFHGITSETPNPTQDERRNP